MSEPAIPGDPSGAERAPKAQRTDPRGFMLKAIESLRAGVLPLAFLAFTRMDEGAAMVLIVSGVAGALLLLVSGVSSYLQWTRLTYSVNETDIRVESGVLSKKARSVPYDRIQDIATSQGFLARMFGLVEITFDTGAGAGEDISLSYLSEEEGERLRRLVRDRRADGVSSADRQATAGDVEEAARPLFAMGPRRVLLYGLTNFSLVVFAAVGGFLAQYDEILPFDIWDIEGWQQRLAGPGTWLANLGFVAQAIGVLALLFFLALFGFATGIVRTALTEWNFRLERTTRGFRRRRGMVTRTDVTLPIRRVQAAIVGARLLERGLGYNGAALVSLAADAGASNHEIAPFARWEEIAPLIEEAGLRVPHDGLEWTGVSKVHAVATALLRLRFWLFLALVVAGIQFFVEPEGFLGEGWLAAIPAVIGLWKALRSLMAVLRTFYAVDDSQLYVRSGWLATTLMLVPREKLHSVTIGHGPLSRRFAYAFFSGGVAGASFGIDGIPMHRAYELRTDLLRSMQKQDFSRIN